MKKLLLLTLTFTLFTCSGGDDDNNNSGHSWSGNYITDTGDQGTWTLVADYEDDGSGYVEYSGSLSSNIYGEMEFDGYIDIDFLSANTYGGSVDYGFEADINDNTLSNGLVFEDNSIEIGTFTGTKN